MIYYPLKNSDTEIDYENGPVIPAPSDVKPVKKGDGTYNLYDVDPTDPSKSTKYGAMFEDLPTKEIYMVSYLVKNHLSIVKPSKIAYIGMRN